MLLTLLQAAVPELTDANANETLSSGSDTVVMFYAEKCAECMVGDAVGSLELSITAYE